MEFSGQYLTWEEYKALGGTALDLMPFNLLEFECRRKIDIRTQNRLKNLPNDEIPEEVRICEFNMINKLLEYSTEINKNSNSENNKNIISENIDGYSVTYANGSQIQELMKTKKKEINDIITNSLIGVIVNNEHIMYLGDKE